MPHEHDDSEAYTDDQEPEENQRGDVDVVAKRLISRMTLYLAVFLKIQPSLNRNRLAARLLITGPSPRIWLEL